jgi:hypothetical protein
MLPAEILGGSSYLYNFLGYKKQSVLENFDKLISTQDA